MYIYIIFLSNGRSMCIVIDIPIELVSDIKTRLLCYYIISFYNGISGSSIKNTTYVIKQ